MRKAFQFCVLFAALSIGSAQARVERIEILARETVADGKAFGKVGAYERIAGRLHLSLNPQNAYNASIADIDLAPTAADGNIKLTSDFFLLRPLDPSKGNGRLFYGVNNRGGLGLLRLFNDGRGRGSLSEDDMGNGFLMEQGYTLLWSAWNWDVRPGPGRLNISLPRAQENGRLVRGRVTHEITVTSPTAAAPLRGMLAIGFPPASRPNARLDVQDTWDTPRRTLPTENWRFARQERGAEVEDPNWLTLDGGFEPGKLYHMSYEAEGPPILGLGLAAIRDALSFFKFEDADAFGQPNPLLERGGSKPQWTLAWGHSQSGRVLTTMVLDGLHVDEAGRIVMDGVFATIPGGGKGSFNIRFGQTSRHMGHQTELDFPTDWFPFASMPQTDAVTGQTASLFDEARRLDAMPKFITVNSSSDYWNRAASMIHTTVDGATDAQIDPNMRIYAIASGPHAPSRAPARGTLSQCHNPLNYRPVFRAMLVHLDAWVSQGTPPPDNRYALASQGELVDLEAYVADFPAIAGARLPTDFHRPPRLDFGDRYETEGIMDRVPPRRGQPFGTRVPKADENGNDIAGIRMPAVQVPLGTYTGWNLQSPETGAADRLNRWIGSFIPFAATRSERLAAGDSRPSVTERYESKEAYVTAVAEATLSMAADQLILGMDIDPIIEEAGAFYDRVLGQTPDNESCQYLAP